MNTAETNHTTGNSSSSTAGGSGNSGNSSSGNSGGDGGNGCALNKLIWSHDGRMLYIGDAKGCVHMIGVHESLLKASTAEEQMFELTMMQRTASVVVQEKEMMTSS